MITRMLAGFTLVALAFAISGATIDLRVSPDSILPGTSADLVVTVTNSGAEPVVFLAEVALHVSPPVGEPFFATRDFTTNETKFREIPEEFLPAADDDDEDEESPTADEEPQTDDRRVVRIAPGEKFLFEVPFFHNVTFFQDERLTSPGRYGLRAVMVTIEGAEVRSSESILYVVEPAGVDAEVWSEMKRLCSLEPCAWGRWQIRGYDRRILTQFAESSYAKYATSYDFHTRDDAAHRREIGMTGPFREHILLYEADDVLSLALTRAIERESSWGRSRGQ